MINNNDKKENSEIKDSKDVKKPNEDAGFYISTHLKIYDPNTKEVLVQKRADR